MCEECDAKWAIYKKKEMEFQAAKQEYLDQTKKLCKEKEHEPEPESPASKEETILREHDFLESSGKPGLYFKKPDENSVVFIDLRKGSPRTYGFSNDAPMEHNAVHGETKDAVNAIRMLTAKESGQMELDLEGDDQ